MFTFFIKQEANKQAAQLTISDHLPKAIRNIKGLTNAATAFKVRKGFLLERR